MFIQIDHGLQLHQRHMLRPKAVSTRHVSEPFAIDRERFAACCPCPHGRNHLSTRNERARTVRDRSRPVDFVVWMLDRALAPARDNLTR